MPAILNMLPLLFTAITFVAICVGSIGTMLVSARLPARYRDVETDTVFRMVGSIFALMASLVLGLTVNSAKNTYEGIDANVHAFATNLIVLDRTMRRYGIEGAAARGLLISYVEVAIAQPGRADEPESNVAAQALARFGDALASLRPTQDFHQILLADARRQYEEVVEKRWTIVEQSEGTIPLPIIAMLIVWFTVVFANFGYRAPANIAVVGLFVASAALIAGSLYLVLDMNVPFGGPISISDVPLRRALAEMRALS